MASNFESDINIESLIDKFLSSFPSDPLAPSYHNARKLKAALCLQKEQHIEAAFHLSESTAAALRTMLLYRQEQMELTLNDDKTLNIDDYLKQMENEIDDMPPLSQEDKKLYESLEKSTKKRTASNKKAKDDNPLHKRYLRFSEHNNVDNFTKILNDLPKEWTVVQLTAPYNPHESVKPREQYRAEIESVYITLMCNSYTDVMGTGAVNVNIPANVTKGCELPLFVELYSLLAENLKSMENATREYTQRNIHEYWERRQDIDLRMESVLRVMDTEWLGGWKCLLTGKLVNEDLRERVSGLVGHTCEDWGFIRLTPIQRVLLCNLLQNSHHVPSVEIRATLQKILTDFTGKEDAKSVLEKPDFTGCRKCTKLDVMSMCLKCKAAIFESVHHFKLSDGIKAFMEAARQVKNDADWQELKTAKRHPVVLIVDELLDTFPWESLPILSGHPVTRSENIHMLYHMYKTHENSMRDGYFVIDRHPLQGRYLINPGNNLERMSKRMCGFVSYWCPQWSGDSDRAPEPRVVIDHLTTGDIFLYCGHGDGCQYANSADGRGVEGARGGRATALLSGCGSVRLQYCGRRDPPVSSHYHYHIAGSPLVVGMLWEVSDLEVDKVMTTLLALAVPSQAPLPWEAVGKADWSQGKLDLNADKKATKLGTEQDLLRAIAKARRASSLLMIASSIVARGLPVRLTTENDKLSKD